MSYPNNRHGNTPPYLLSAYGIAVKHGYSGSEEEWLASLKGDQGEYPRLSYQTPTSGDEVQHGIFYRYADEGDWTNLCWLDDLMTAAEADIINAAKEYADTAEAYAKGTVDGEAVEEGDPGYEDNAKYYAGQASTYASAAGGFATGASNYAQAASGYATTASGHADNAATSATAAAGSATSAAGSAASASNSAGSASTSASAAEAQATQAGTYAYNADQSAQQAASYAAAANTAYSAVVDVANGVDVKVEDIETQVSIAAGYASAAGTSATNASGSATAAAGSATAAAGSASNAADSATAAAGSATAAAGSASSVSESAAQITTNKNDIADLKSAINEQIIISDTPPVSENNKIWIDSDAGSVQVPTVSDLTAIITPEKLLTQNSYAQNMSTITYFGRVMTIDNGVINVKTSSIVTNSRVTFVLTNTPRAIEGTYSNFQILLSDLAPIDKIKNTNSIVLYSSQAASPSVIVHLNFYSANNDTITILTDNVCEINSEGLHYKNYTIPAEATHYALIIYLLRTYNLDINILPEFKVLPAN